MQLRHQVGHVDRVVIGRPKVMRRTERLPQVLLCQFVIAVVVEPDAVEVLRIFDVAHGAEGHVDLPVAVILLSALLHLGREHADDRKQHAIQPDRLTHGPRAGKELGLGLRTDHANMRALLILGSVKETPIVRIEFPDVLKHRPDAIHRPRVGVEIVLHRHVFLNLRRDVFDPWNGVLQAVHIVFSEAHLHSGFVAAGLLAGPAGKDADDVGAPLGEDRLNGPAEPCAIGQQQHHRRNPPRHPDHGDGRAAAVVDHRLPSLAQMSLNMFTPASSF